MYETLNYEHINCRVQYFDSAISIESQPFFRQEFTHDENQSKVKFVNFINSFQASSETNWRIRMISFSTERSRHFPSKLNMRTTVTPFAWSSLITNVRRFFSFVEDGPFQPSPVHLNNFGTRTIGNGSSWWHFIWPFTGQRLVGRFLDDLYNAFYDFVSLPKAKETKPAHGLDDGLRVVGITADVRFRGNWLHFVVFVKTCHLYSGSGVDDHVGEEILSYRLEIVIILIYTFFGHALLMSAWSSKITFVILWTLSDVTSRRNMVNFVFRDFGQGLIFDNVEGDEVELWKPDSCNFTENLCDLYFPWVHWLTPIIGDITCAVHDFEMKVLWGGEYV